MAKEYIIVGDTKNHEGCLVATCFGGREAAEKILEQMLNNPTHNDIRAMEGHTNFRVKEVEKRECWWLDPKLVR